MTFDEILAQVIDLLQREGRVSYRALKIRFNLDDEYLEGLKDELIAAKRLAVDEDGKVLVWTGMGGKGETESRETATSDPRPQTLDPRPVSYTPKHLAERILAEQAAMEARGVARASVLKPDFAVSCTAAAPLPRERADESDEIFELLFAELVVVFEHHV